MYDDLPPLNKHHAGLAMATPLEAISMSWSVVVAKDLRPIGFRLKIRSASKETSGLAIATLLDGVIAGFVADTASGMPHGLVILALDELAVDDSIVDWSAPRNVLLEVAQQQLNQPNVLQQLYDAQRHGVRLALRVQDRAKLIAERVSLFQYLIDRAEHASAVRAHGDVALLAIDVTSVEAAEQAFKQGASGTIGWPLTALPSTEKAMQPQQSAVLQLIKLVQADADVIELERAFKAQPVLAYLLLTLANSPAFIRSTPVASLSQAITLLGYKRLVKWLVLLLVIASKNGRALPAIYTAVARGFTMENLASAFGATAAARDECFIIGAFSMLDQIIGQPLARLIAEVSLPDSLTEALLSGTGRYGQYLALTQALEQSDHTQITQLAQAIELPLEQVNNALLQALAATDALQTVV